jgi:hypothetical protein
MAVPYEWDPDAGRYRDPDGKLVPTRVIRQAVQATVADTGDRLQVLAERYRDGRLDVLQWREAVRKELRTGYGVAASLAQGGVGQMDPPARGVLSGLLRRQYTFVDLFALDLQQGRIDPASDAFLARARQYAGGAHTTYQAFTRRGASTRGHDEERNVLEPGATHCAGCQAAADQGWVPLGTLPLPGDRDCVSNCRCELETRVSQPEEVAA